MGFLWKHKLFTLLICAALSYWFFNKPHQFGFFNTTDFVIYNRIPVPHFDLFVDAAGNASYLENLNKPRVFEELCSKLAVMANERYQQQPTLLVGNGFGATPQFSLYGTAGAPQTIRYFHVREMPSAAAIRNYNQLRAEGRPVAIILKVKKS